MFGYLVCNEYQLSEAQRQQYKKYYCGLCQQLKDDYGSRKTLTYDLNFVHILLSSLYSCEENTGELKCPLHPFKKQQYIRNEWTHYCAAMNDLLFYFKMLDDVNDDHSSRAKRIAGKMKPQIEIIASEYPRQYKTSVEVLRDIGEMERNNILNPDLPANAFGRLMGTLFMENRDNETLFSFGYHLGRYIYLLDAVLDLKSDIRKQRYNPLIRVNSADFEEMLMMVMQQCAEEYEKLPLRDNKDILDNIVYSGIWVAYRTSMKGKETK
ncbi:MAG: hypothetical protein IJM15_06910 [Erysipelotrichaceae bacterium]|nr:hypothetical protein [Erysipelotrichaceae bacterium]